MGAGTEEEKRDCYEWLREIGCWYYVWLVCWLADVLRCMCQGKSCALVHLLGKELCFDVSVVFWCNCWEEGCVLMYLLCFGVFVGKRVVF